MVSDDRRLKNYFGEGAFTHSSARLFFEPSPVGGECRRSQ